MDGAGAVNSGIKGGNRESREPPFAPMLRRAVRDDDDDDEDADVEVPVSARVELRRGGAFRSMLAPVVPLLLVSSADSDSTFSWS